ncbi:MAG: ABC transporter substrate-binding protein [Candidatus Adiutrix sp.]|jgi:iron complex transport system substrate-binding protein|nr:ABC transporter substrate-binding protein [Candidatus Adiutrix sp.]
MKKALRLTVALALLITAAPPLSFSAEEKARPRIISLYAAHTEVLLRLGARDNLVGVSAQESYSGPETEGRRPPVFTMHDDVEKFLAAKPDLVLMRLMHKASAPHLVAALENSGVRVYAAQVVKAGDLYKYWRNLAALVGREKEAEKMIADFDARVSLYHKAAQARAERDKPGVFLEAVHEQVKTFTPDSLPVWLVELAGAKNVAADAKPHSPKLVVANYGPERLLAKADQVDILISQMGPMNTTSLKQVKTRRIYRTLKAVKEGRVYKISEAILSRPTPSLLAGLEQMAAWTGLEVEVPLSSGTESLTDGPAPDEELAALPPSQNEGDRNPAAVIIDHDGDGRSSSAKEP